MKSAGLVLCNNVQRCRILKHFENGTYGSTAKAKNKFKGKGDEFGNIGYYLHNFIVEFAYNHAK